MPTVLISAPYMMPYLNRFIPVLESFGLEVIVADVTERLSEEELLDYSGRFDGVICGDDRFTEYVMRQCLPRLKVISKWGTGIDSIDRNAAIRLGIQVRNTLNAFTMPVADSVIGYILAFARQQPWLDTEMKSGHWKKLIGRCLCECTLGVVGVGNIGKAVLRRAKSFEMGILGNDIVPIAPDFISETAVEMTGLQDLLQRSDFISVNCDLNPTSFHIINEQSLTWMKSGAVLINTARGPLIDEAALIEALQNGKLAGAALDVFEVEPLPVESPLLKMENVMLAPHNSNSSPAAWERVHWNTIRHLLEGLNIPTDELDVWKQKV